MKRSMVLGIFAVSVLALAAMAFAGQAHGEGDDHGDMHGDMHKGAGAPMVFDSPQEVGAQATCPVTKNTFTIQENNPQSEVDGKYVYFCCNACKPKFDADPQKYLHDNK